MSTMGGSNATCIELERWRVIVDPSDIDPDYFQKVRREIAEENLRKEIVWALNRMENDEELREPFEIWAIRPSSPVQFPSIDEVVDRVCKVDGGHMANDVRYILSLAQFIMNDVDHHWNFITKTPTNSMGIVKSYGTGPLKDSRQQIYRHIGGLATPASYIGLPTKQGGYCGECIFVYKLL